MSAVMTAMLLFGMSLYYSQFGTLSFQHLNLDNSLASVVGTVFVLCGLLFNLGVVPFHSWMVDMYERAPLALIMFLETTWKFFMVFTFIKVFFVVITGESGHYQSVLTILSAISMLFGALMPIFQTNIRKFIAYASSGHVGFILAIFATTNSMLPTSMAMTYMAMYSIPAICFFSVLLVVNSRNKVENFWDLSGLIYRKPVLGFGILLPLFAMIGLPPFPSFLAKLSIFRLLAATQSYILLTVSVIYSLLSLFYAAKCARYLFRRTKLEINIFSKSGTVVAVQLMALIATLFMYSHIEQWFISVVNKV
jgi:NADH-quinone oxidoreductase subunit N